MTDDTRRRLGWGLVGLVGGLFLGGFLWGKPQKTVEQRDGVVTVFQEKIVEVVVTVFQEKTVWKDRWLTADKEEIVEMRQPDGTLTITTSRYGLGISETEQASETLSIGTALHSTEATSAGLRSSESTIVDSHRWMIGIGYSSGLTLLQPWDCASRCVGIVGYRPFEAPFWMVGWGGVNGIGLGVTMSF